MGLNVLVVDDDVEAAESLAQLVRLLGHDAVAATGGDQAVDAASRTRFDVALLDLAMPGMDGLELARRLIVMRRGGLYLVAVTGRDSDADLLESASAGIVEHVVKPCTTRVLEGVFERAAARGAGRGLATLDS